MCYLRRALLYHNHFLFHNSHCRRFWWTLWLLPSRLVDWSYLVLFLVFRFLISNFIRLDLQVNIYIHWFCLWNIIFVRRNFFLLCFGEGGYYIFNGLLLLIGLLFPFAFLSVCRICLKLIGALELLLHIRY